MTKNDMIVNKLCKRVDNDMGDGTTTAKLLNFETIILTQTQKRTNPRRLSVLRTVLIAAGLLTLLIPLGWYLTLHLLDSPLTFELDNQVAISQGNVVLHTGDTDTQAVHFENGSSIALMSNTAATMEKATQNGVEVQLAQGELFLDVEGKESDAWAVKVENYRVSVLGTQFYVKWHNRGKVLDVRVVKGTVLVEGTHAGQSGIEVSADSHLRLDTQIGFFALNNMSSAFYDASSPTLLRSDIEIQSHWDERLNKEKNTVTASSTHPSHALSAIATKTPTAKANQSPATPIGTNAAQSRGHQKKIASKHSGHKQKISSAPTRNDNDALPQTENHEYLMQLLDERRYEDAITAAQATGFSNVVHSASLAQLWRLMNAARKTNRDELAQTALLGCRSRFADSDKGKLAAFVLGKINYYGQNNKRAASKWFETYLREAPLGPLAEEALGRLVLIHREQGNSNKAQTLATQYLKQYPAGAFSKTCHGLIKK